MVEHRLLLFISYFFISLQIRRGKQTRDCPKQYFSFELEMHKNRQNKKPEEMWLLAKAEIKSEKKDV